MDSYLNENQSENGFQYNQESLIENNSINLELENRWNEIEEITQQKINKNNESRKLNDLNEYSIMKIDLNSLIHPIEEDSEFEEYCKFKIKQLDKLKNKINLSSNYSGNTFNFGNANTNISSNNIKSFLTDINYDNELYSKKKGKITLNELVEMTKNRNSRKKLDINKFIEIIDETDNNKSSIVNMANSFENGIMNKSDSNMMNKFNNKLRKEKSTFLKSDDNNILDKKDNLFDTFTQTNRNINNKYKEYLGNNNNLTNNYRNKKIINYQINDNGIKNKIEESYNYLYSLYPNLRKNNFFTIK